MNVFERIFGRFETDSVERETAVVTAQRAGQREREQKSLALRQHVGDTDPGYTDAVARRRRELGR